MYGLINHPRYLFVERFSLLLQILIDILQIGASFVITNWFNGYWKSGQNYYKLG